MQKESFSTNTEQGILLDYGQNITLQAFLSALCHCRTSSYILLPDASCCRFLKNKANHSHRSTDTVREALRRKYVYFGNKPKKVHWCHILSVRREQKASWFPPHIYKMRQAEMSYDKRLFKKRKKEMKIDIHVTAVPG